MEGFILGSSIIAALAVTFTLYIHFTTAKHSKKSHPTNIKKYTGNINLQIEEMKKEWSILDIQEDFPKVHHFSSDKFTSSPPSLQKHYNYCKRIGRITGENVQTLKRAIEVASLVKKGKNIEEALTLAWGLYPIIKR